MGAHPSRKSLLARVRVIWGRYELRGKKWGLLSTGVSPELKISPVFRGAARRLGPGGLVQEVLVVDVDGVLADVVDAGGLAVGGQGGGAGLPVVEEAGLVARDQERRA